MSALDGEVVAHFTTGFTETDDSALLAPLGMRDTDFQVPAAKLARFAGCGVFTHPQKGPLRMDADGAHSAYASAPIFPSGAAGSVNSGGRSAHKRSGGIAVACVTLAAACAVSLANSRYERDSWSKLF